MKSSRIRLRCAILLSLVCAAFLTANGQTAPSRGELRGQVKDELEAVIVGATVILTDAQGVAKTTETDGGGSYHFTELSPGEYTLQVSETGFATYEQLQVSINSGKTERINIILSVALEKQEITVTDDLRVTTSADSTVGAVVLEGSNLDSLPDDPDNLGEAVSALAGPSSGQSSTRFFVDGFPTNRLPSKKSISKIVINQNQPFSAEYDKLSFGRVEVFTKPGTSKFHGQGSFYFNDESLNTRNPYSPTRSSFQERRYEFTVSGPIIPKKASFFLDFNRRETNDNAIINAFVLDSAFRQTNLRTIVSAPQRRMSISPRFDYQLNRNNTLIARYRFTRLSAENAGIGAFVLESRAHDAANTEHVAQLSETAILSPTVVNETQFQFVREHREQNDHTGGPSISVVGSFDGGGGQLGTQSNKEDRWEVQNYTSWAKGHHFLKVGARLHYNRVVSQSTQDFRGTFIFASLDEYREVLRRTPGIRPALFSLSGGQPEARVAQYDLGVFVQNTWQVRPNFTFSSGLRYETQNNIDSKLNFAPRVAFAWAPGAAQGKQPMTVIRGGFGIFYERFNHNLVMQTDRFDGVNQKRLFLLFPNFFPNVPSIDTLFALRPQSKLTRRIAPDLEAPYTLQTAISVERRLPYNTTLTATFINTRTLHALRSRNINAFIPEDLPNILTRPLGFLEGDIFQYESSGKVNQRQLTINANNRLSKKVSWFATYVLNRILSDTEGAESFPVNSFDASGEYGRSELDVRHRFFIGGTIAAPLGLQFNPFIAAFSGRPFNITTGDDPNRDTQFNERPAFATDLKRTSVFFTEFGAFDRRPLPGQQIIPRNFGQGPPFMVANLRVSRVFGFGDKNVRNGSAERSSQVTLAVQVQNLLNHTNPDRLIGNLRSPLFGQTNVSAGGFGLSLGSTSAGNRRFEVQVHFSF